ncbi:protease complex subunit PrcB family protein [Deinococcus detaillensis]|uniref:Protease complex subunit PrcB family protein n=1 Tax=Deinococcus detaillensis TaxID=2592048 RepID=A0A553ULJ7_9DEIO|nr:protease complex subunit PrcB family protein [Deinococcus detaillensis]TSA81080.1 protease complex subunit PrcB family protein [Deinococcus detaillensis]
MKNSTGLKLAAALLGTGLLAGCTMSGPSNISVHEVLLYGSSQDRLAWVYGNLSGGQGSLSIDGKALALRPQTAGDLATPGSLNVGGANVYKGRTRSLLPPESVVQQGTANAYTISATQDIDATYLVSGGTWYQLSGALAAGSSVQASAQTVSGLVGAGQLTGSEAAVLSGVLAKQGVLVVTVLPAGALPDAALKVEPAPTETKRTGLYLQPLSVATATSTTTTTTGGNVSSIPATSSTVGFREVASGNNAQASSVSVVLANSQSALDALWNTAYARQVPVPPTPIIVSQTAVGIFLGSRPTGGYGLTVQSVRASGSALEITVNLRSPGSGTITTQSITSPWTIVSVQGLYRTVTVRDQNGQLLIP